MAILGQSQFVERLQFFNGQRLFAVDLDAIERFHREMRWLHNQSLHQPGVGRGFAVTGLKGEREVAIQEGYGIDRDGREIVLTIPRREQVPPVAGDDGIPAVYDLAVAYPEDSEDLPVSETRQGLCSTAGAVRRREEPILCWVEIGADGQPKDPGLKTRMATAQIIRIARVQILECKLYADVSIAERRNARPPQQPYIACGISKPDWKLVPATLAASDLASVFALTRFLTATIDTAAAGFRTPPGYFLEIRGKRVATTATGTFMIDGLVYVVDRSALSIDIEVDVLVQRISGKGGITIDSASFADWEVTWMGVEG